MIKYVNKLKVENISEFYIMISLYEYFLIKPHKKTFKKDILNKPYKMSFKKTFKKIFKKIFKKDILNKPHNRYFK